MTIVSETQLLRLKDKLTLAMDPIPVLTALESSLALTANEISTIVLNAGRSEQISRLVDRLLSKYGDVGLDAVLVVLENHEERFDATGDQDQESAAVVTIKDDRPSGMCISDIFSCMSVITWR